MRTRGYNSCTSWVACFACSILGLLLPIPMRIAGLLFIILIDDYDTDRLHATIPIIVFGMIRTITGPFTGYLGQVFGLRAVTLLGCFLSTIGVGACFFAESITTVIIYLGFIYGVGFGLGSTLIPAILRQHFEEDLNLVNGIYLTGSCLGAIIIPKVVQFLIRNYGYSGMFLLLSGILLNSVPFAILLKDPKNEEYKLKAEEVNNINRKSIDSSLNVYSSQITPPEDVENGKKCKNKKKMCNKEVFIENIKETISGPLQKAKIKGVTNPTFSLGSETINQVECLKFKSISDDHENTACNNLNKPDVQAIEQNSPGKSTTSISKLNLEISDKYELNKLRRMEKRRSTIISKISLPGTSTPKSDFQILFHLFLDPTFHIQMTVQSIFAFVTTLNWTIVIDYARDKGISEESSLMFVMYLPLSEMMGNLSLNWISDRGYLSRINYGMICLLILSADAVFLVYAFDYGLMMLGILIFGFVSGSLGATFPGMIHEFIEEDLQSMALASRFVLYSIFCCTKSPIIGYFRGTLGSYNWVLYIISMCCILSAILVQFTPVLANIRQKRRLKESKR